MNQYTLHINLYDPAFLGAIFIGLTFAILLGFVKRTNQPANRFLSLALVVVVCWIIRILCIDIGLATYFSRWNWLPLQFSLALGPLLYFFVLKTTKPEYQFLRKDLLHFVPVLLEQGMLMMESKRTSAVTYHTVAFFPMNALLHLAAFISVTVYLSQAFKLIAHFYQGLKFNHERDRYHIELQWLQKSLTGFGVLWFLWIPFTAINYIYYHQANITVYHPLYLLLAMTVIWIGAVSFLRQEDSVTSLEPSLSKPSASAALKQQGVWLKRAIETNRYYKDEELSLSSLAEALKIQPHELSRIINVALKKNFNDLINEYRIREVTRKMRDPAYDRLTLLGIAFDSGFNSKTTFNRTFKQITGKSPAEYKNELKKERPDYNLERSYGSAAIISNHGTTPKWSGKKLNRNFMFRNYLKIAWRNIIRNKAYSAINMAGLTVGIAACLLICVVVQYELSFDTYQPRYKTIYRMVTKKVREGGTRYSVGISSPAVAALRLYFPQATVAGVNAINGSQVAVPTDAKQAGDNLFLEKSGMMFAEPQLFELFPATWLAGKPDVLKDPNMVVLDQSTAEKYFGKWQSAVDKTLRLDNLVTLKVAGVIRDAPVNTDLPLKILISYITWKHNAKAYDYVDSWNETSSSCQVYVKFPPNISQSTIDKQLRRFSDDRFENKNGVAKQRYVIAQPLPEIHFDTRFSNTLGDHITSRATLRTLSFIAVLIIMMASINFINLSTAQSIGRSKEVGIRKVLGSSRGQLIAQVMGETAIIVLLSAGFAVGVAEFTLPFLKNIASVPDTIGLFNSGTLLCLAAVILIVTLFSGLYPALIVSGFKPVLALKNKINSAAIGGISLRRVLVVIQFSISQLLIIGTVIAIKQMNFVNNADLGFNKDAVLVIPSPTDSIGLSRINSFKLQVLALAGVKAASFAADVPSSSNNNSTDFGFNHTRKEPGFDIFTKVADADYFQTFGLQFVAGHGYKKSDTASEVVINETTMHRLGIQNAANALGKSISLEDNKWLPIVGVVADFKTNSMREEIKPTVLYPDKTFEQEVAVKIQAQNFAKTVAAVQNLWKKTYPDYAYNGFFVDESIARFYKQENQLELIYKTFASVAIFISCLGLYGLVSFMAVQRTREVGVRKVLGASTGSIVYLFSKEFMVLIVLAFAFGAPAAWYLMNGWLQTFVYRISPGVWVFVVAIAISLIIGWLTVGYKALKAALANPVKSLRNE